jgi:DNA mismatch repair protein MutL
MGKIRILSENLIGKIAAGEVVERPASVVKELIENSIDANAEQINVYIKEYGLAQIKVIDDGEGISKEDVSLAFQRHATSKIKDEKDLFKIKTLGFRGEALYSIAQVSKLRVITQQKDENIGTEAYIVGGKIIDIKPAFSKGTTIEITDLFFNTPVRRKFLKSSFTEKAHIIDTLQNYCLAYPEIAFRLFIDEQEVLNTHQVNSQRERIAQVFGVDFLDKLDFKTISEDKYKIELFLGREDLSRSKRSRQLIFINRRPVKEPSIAGTLYKALQINYNHPLFFIFITMPSEEVDFNVHPTKKEVRFQKSQIIHQLIFKMLNSDSKPLILSESKEEWKIEPNSFYVMQGYVFEKEASALWKENLEFFPLGNAIVAIKKDDGVMFLDYHAAHERVNFEKILNKTDEQIVRLVFPQIIQLDPKDYIVIKENLQILNELGIEAEDFGKNSIIIRAIPDILKNADLAGIIESIAVTLKEETSKPDFIDIKRKISATVACHSSLRANNRINAYEIIALLKELEKTSDPEHCPHGRPLKKFFSKEEIKKWFKK